MKTNICLTIILCLVGSLDGKEGIPGTFIDVDFNHVNRILILISSVCTAQASLCAAIQLQFTPLRAGKVYSESFSAKIN